MPQFAAAVSAVMSTAVIGSITVGNIIATAYIVGSAYESRRRARSMARAARQAYYDSLQDRSLTIRSAMAPKATVYGVDKVGGPLVDMFTTGDKQQYLHMLVELAGHESQAIESVYLNEWEITAGDIDSNGFVTLPQWGTVTEHMPTDMYATADGSGVVTLTHTASEIVSVTRVYGGDTGPDVVTGWAHTAGSAAVTGLVPGANYQVAYKWVQTDSRVRIHRFLGASGETVPTALLDETDGRRTSAHTPAGITWVWVRIEWDQQVFGSIGIPNISAKVKGKKLYDPRTTGTAWSDNWALCVRDYLRDPLLGMGCTAAEVPDGEISVAANISDELVALTAGGATQARYTCNGTLSAADARLASLDSLLEAGAGSAVWTQGRWYVRAGAHPTPEPITLTIDHMAGAPRIQGAAPMRGLYNAVTATYREPSAGWVEQQAPQVVNTLYETEDGGQRKNQPLQLGMVSDAWRAQRLAKIMLERARQAESIEVECNLKAYDLLVGSVVPVTVARYGWSSKLFEVRSRELNIAAGTVRYQLVATAESVWDWAYGEATAVDPAPNTSLPSPFTTPDEPTLTLTTGTETLLRLQDGTMAARVRADWTLTGSTSTFVERGGRIELQWQVQGAAEWQTEPAMPGDATRLYIGPLDEGVVVTVRVRAVSSTGRRSTWATQAILVVGKSAPPSDVAAFSGAPFAGGVEWAWTPCPDIDYAHTEVRDADADWGSDSVPPLYRGRASRWPETNASTTGITRYARHVDSSGNVSVASATATQTPGDSAAGSQNVLLLQPPSGTLYANSNGQVTDFSTADTLIRVLDGTGSDVTGDWTLSRTDYGVVSTLSGPDLSVDGWDPAEVSADAARAVFLMPGQGDYADYAASPTPVFETAGAITTSATGGPLPDTGYVQIGTPGASRSRIGAAFGPKYPYLWNEDDDVSLSGWVKLLTSPNSTGSSYQIMGNGGFQIAASPNGASGWRLHGTLFGAKTSATFSPTTVSVQVTASFLYASDPYDQWRFVELTYHQSTRRLRLFVDGVKVAESPIQANPAGAYCSRYLVSRPRNAFLSIGSLQVPTDGYDTGLAVALADCAFIVGPCRTADYTAPTAIRSRLAYAPASSVEVRASKAGQVLAATYPIQTLPGPAPTVAVTVDKARIEVNQSYLGVNNYTGSNAQVKVIVNGADDTTNWDFQPQTTFDTWTLTGTSVNGLIAVNYMYNSTATISCMISKSGLPSQYIEIPVVRITEPKPAQSTTQSLSAITLPTDAYGAVTSYSGALTSCRVYEGTTESTSTYTWAATVVARASDGSTISGSPVTYTMPAPSSGNAVVLTITAVASNVASATITITGTKSGWTAVTFRFDLFKLTASAPAPTGAVVSSMPPISAYIEAAVGGTESVGLRYNPDGTIERRQGTPGSWVSAGNWYYPTTSGIGTGKYVRLPPIMGDSAYTSGPFGVWTEMASAVEYSIGTNTQSAGEVYSSGTALISTAAAGAAVAGTGTVNLISYRQSA